MTWLAFLLPFALFVAFPSRMWNFDGVACAAALELGNPWYFFHSNHLLYAALGFLFWKPLALLGLPRALPGLQLFTSLLSAGGAVGLFVLLRILLKNVRMALVLTLSICVSAVMWVWSVEAQVYALGFLALSWGTCELFKPDSPERWRRIGWLHAGAVLGHIVHVLWLIPVLYVLRKESTSTHPRAARDYLSRFILGAAVPYALVIGWMSLKRNFGAYGMIKWLLGSISLNPNSLFEWHFSGIHGPALWAMASPRIFWGTFWPYHVAIPFWCGLLTVFSVAAVIFLLGLSWKKRRDTPWMFAVIWLAVYGVFFWSWEPTTECYRMTDLIPLAILLALGVQTLLTAAQRWVAVSLLIITLIPINLYTRIVPMHDAQRNGLYQQTLALERLTTGNALYLTAGGTPWIYILYFCGRTAWNVRSLMRNPQRLRSEINRHHAAGPVYVHTDALRLEGAAVWMPDGPQKSVDNLPWVQLL